MTDDPLVHRMTEALVAAQRRHRKSQTGFGAYVTPAIPQQALDAFAAVMVPVIRQIVAEAVAQERAAPVVVVEDRSEGSAETARAVRATSRLRFT